MCSARLLHLLGDMAVYIKRKGCCGMAQIALHRLDIVAGADGSDGVGVPEIVKAGFRPPDCCRSLLESAVYGGFCQRASDLVGKDESVFSHILPTFRRCWACAVLCCFRSAMTAEAGAMVRLLPFFVLPSRKPPPVSRS